MFGDRRDQPALGTADDREPEPRVAPRDLPVELVEATGAQAVGLEPSGDLEAVERIGRIGGGGTHGRQGTHGRYDPAMSFMPNGLSWRRRLLSPALIVVVALVIWSRGKPAAQPPESGPAIAALDEPAVRGGDAAATSPAVAGVLARAVAGVDPATIAIEVREGEPRAEAAGATHHAIVSRDGRPWLVVRARYDPDPALRELLGVTTLE